MLQPIEKFYQEVKAVVTCAVCTDVWKNPHTLICRHTFCLDCINRLPEIRQYKVTLLFIGRKQFKTPCPVCRQLFKKDSIQKDFKMFSLAEIVMAFKESKACKRSCSLCEKQSADFFCRKCTQLLCTSCQICHVKTTKCCKMEHSITCVQYTKAADEYKKSDAGFQPEELHARLLKEYAMSKGLKKQVKYMKNIMKVPEKVLSSLGILTDKPTNATMSDRCPLFEEHPQAIFSRIAGWIDNIDMELAESEGALWDLLGKLGILIHRKMYNLKDDHRMVIRFDCKSNTREPTGANGIEHSSEVKKPGWDARNVKICKNTTSHANETEAIVEPTNRSVDLSSLMRMVNRSMPCENNIKCASSNNASMFKDSMQMSSETESSHFKHKELYLHKYETDVCVMTVVKDTQQLENHNQTHRFNKGNVKSKPEQPFAAAAAASRASAPSGARNDKIMKEIEIRAAIIKWWLDKLGHSISAPVTSIGSTKTNIEIVADCSRSAPVVSTETTRPKKPKAVTETTVTSTKHGKTSSNKTTTGRTGTDHAPVNCTNAMTMGGAAATSMHARVSTNNNDIEHANNEIAQTHIQHSTACTVTQTTSNQDVVTSKANTAVSSKRNRKRSRATIVRRQQASNSTATGVDSMNQFNTSTQVAIANISAQPGASQQQGKINYVKILASINRAFTKYLTAILPIMPDHSLFLGFMAIIILSLFTLIGWFFLMP